MAWIAGDSFDYYGSVADVARSVWDSFDSTKCSLTAIGTRFGTGQMLQRIQFVSGPWLTKTIGSNESTLFVALAYYRSGTLSGTTAETYVTFRDGATAQCTVVFESSGNIVLKSGTETGTVLATYTAAFGQDVWTHFQVKVTIHNTTGAITVRKNGATTDSFTATGLNTRGGTANNYATVVVVGNGNGGVVNPPNSFVDDLLVYSASGAAPNDWIGDVRAIVLPVSGAGASSQFAASATVGTFGEASTGTTFSPNQNIVYWFGGVSLTDTGPFFGRTGVLTKISLTLTSALTGAIQAAIYAVDPATGKPGTRLAVSAAATNPAAGLLDLAVTAGPTLSGLQRYFLAFLASGFPNLSGRAGTGTSYSLAQPYASGFPVDGALATTVSIGQIMILATVTDALVAVSDSLGNGDVDYVFDATVGHEDLYAVYDLPVVPAAVIGVVSKVFIKKSDAGSRNGAVRLRSGATDVTGTDTPLSSSYTYLSNVHPVDPATGTAWTLAAVNALQVGQKVTA